jgi:hypothetical protein
MRTSKVSNLQVLNGYQIDPPMNSTLRSQEAPDSAKVNKIGQTKKKLESARRSRI